MQYNNNRTYVNCFIIIANKMKMCFIPMIRFLRSYHLCHSLTHSLARSLSYLSVSFILCFSIPLSFSPPLTPSLIPTVVFSSYALASCSMVYSQTYYRVIVIPSALQHTSDSYIYSRLKKNVYKIILNKYKKHLKMNKEIGMILPKKELIQVE